MVHLFLETWSTSTNLEKLKHHVEAPRFFLDGPRCFKHREAPKIFRASTQSGLPRITLRELPYTSMRPLCGHGTALENTRSPVKVQRTHGASCLPCSMRMLHFYRTARVLQCRTMAAWRTHWSLREFAQSNSRQSGLRRFVELLYSIKPRNVGTQTNR